MGVGAGGAGQFSKNSTNFLISVFGLWLGHWTCLTMRQWGLTKVEKEGQSRSQSVTCPVWSADREVTLPWPCVGRRPTDFVTAVLIRVRLLSPLAFRFRLVPWFPRGVAEFSLALGTRTSFVNIRPSPAGGAGHSAERVTVVVVWVTRDSKDRTVSGDSLAGERKRDGGVGVSERERG